MNNALLAIGAVLIAALAALFAVPYAVDWNGYRGVFEEEASRILGRDVRVGGKVDVRLLPIPYVSFGKLRIADTVNETGEPLFRADSFTMWLSVPPLLRGVLEARAVELKKPVLRLVVDPEKGGNWASASAGAVGTGSLPFLPHAVALQSVRVSNGQVVVTRADNSPLAELSAIDGELEAEALDGPFRFKGNARWNDSPRELRLATARMDADGSMRFKTTVRVAETANSYVLEGRVADLKQRPRLEGELTAKLSVPEIGVGGAQQRPENSAKTAQGTDKPQIEMRAQMAADGTGFKLTDLNLSIDNVGQPQLITGDAEMAWVAARPVIKVRLGSRLIDLDRLAGGEAHPVPELVQALTMALVGALPVNSDVSTFLSIDAVTLGRQDVSGLSVLVERANGKLELKDLKAGVPGGGRLDAFGEFGGDKQREFNGQLALRGTSLQRFLDWAVKGASAGRADGPFLLQGKLGLTGRSIDLTEASAEIGGMPVTGGIRYQAGDRARIAITLDGRRVDAAQLWALAGSTAAPLPELLPPGLLTGATADAKPSEAKSIHAADLDFALRVRAGELVLGAATLTDAAADLALEGDKLKLTALKGVTADGLALEIEGDVANFARDPRGRLAWVASAPTDGAMQALIRLAGLDAAGAQGFAATLVPARIAGTTRLGAGAGKSTEVAFDGAARSGRLSGRVRIDGERHAWRNAALDITAALDSDDVDAVVQRVLPGSLAPGARSPRRPGRIEVKSAGTPETGIKTLFVAAADGIDAAFDGLITAPAAAPLTTAGTLRMNVASARLPAAMLGLQLSAGAADTRLAGEGELVVTGDQTRFTAHGLDVAGSRLDGTIAMSRPAGKPRRIAADLKIDAASAAALLALFSDRSPGDTSPAEIRARPGWPDAPFDLAMLDTLEGTVKARIASLAVQPDMTLRNADLEAAIEPRKLVISRLEGDALQGRSSVTLTLERQPAGVALSGAVKLAGLKLDQLNGVEEARRVRGEAGASFDLAGTGLNWASLIVNLRGKGEASINDAEITGFAPDAISAFADSVLVGKTEREGEALQKALREAFGQGTLKFNNRKLPIEIADGAARLGALIVDTPGGRTSLTATVDLSQMKVDGEWRIEPKVSAATAPSAAAAARGPLPYVSMVYVGALSNLAAIEPRLNASALERELSVRRMEREVEELERLRKADEERARAEQERLRQLEADRAKSQPQQQPEQGAANAPSAGTPPVPAPAWSGTTSVTPDAPANAAKSTASPSDASVGASAGADPAPAAADAKKDAAIRPQGEAAKPAARPPAKARPRQESGSPFFKWN